MNIDIKKKKHAITGADKRKKIPILKKNSGFLKFKKSLIPSFLLKFKFLFRNFKDSEHSIL